MLCKVFYYQIEFVKKLIELTVTSFGDLLLNSVSYIWSNGKLSPALLTIVALAFMLLDQGTCPCSQN